MKNLDTSDIASGVKYSFEKRSVEYLYASNKEMINAIAQSIGGDIDGTSAYAIYGMIETDLGGGNFSYSKGAVYDSATEEVYFFDEVASIAIGIDPVLTIVETTPAAYNPIKFSDGNNKLPHKEKKVTISSAALGSADMNYEDVVIIKKPWKQYEATGSEMSTSIGVWVLGAIGTVVLDYWIRNGTVTINFTAKKTEVTSGSASIPQWIFDLPAEIPDPLINSFGSGRFSNDDTPNGDGSGDGRIGLIIEAKVDGTLKFDSTIFNNMTATGTENITILGSVRYPHV